MHRTGCNKISGNIAPIGREKNRIKKTFPIMEKPEKLNKSAKTELLYCVNKH